MFTAEKGALAGYGYELITMKGAGHEVRILPQAGFNLYYWTFNGGELLMEPVDITVFGTKYGIPLLFPTPNRIRNATYVWKGKEYVMTKRGEKVLLHGLVKDEPFAVTALTADAEKAVCAAEISIKPGDALYEGYPFACTLRVTYTLTAEGLRCDVTVTNDGGEEMPFGFASHPYFSKRGDASRVYLTSPVRRYYEADEALIPSGRILPVEPEKTVYDGFHSVESLYLDNVFRGMTADMESQVKYEDAILHIRASDCFRNAVIYTPHDRPGFCIEPQTCATNFINMHESGLVDESGLLTLPAGKTFSAWIDYAVEKR